MLSREQNLDQSPGPSSGRNRGQTIARNAPIDSMGKVAREVAGVVEAAAMAPARRRTREVRPPDPVRKVEAVSTATAVRIAHSRSEVRVALP